MKFSIVRLAGLAVAFGICASLAPSAASAGSAGPVSVPVSATVAQNCKMSLTTGVSFGSYDPVNVSGVTDGTGALSVTCTKAASGVTLTLDFGGGTTTGCGSDKRAMSGGTNHDALCYDIYEDSGYTTRFPNTAVSETVSGGITTPTSISLYGQIKAAAQDVSVDSYSDTVHATLNF